MAEFIPAKYVPAKRNNGKLLVDNNHFVYNLVKKREKKTYWGCQKKTSLGCKVTATVLCKLDENGEPDDEIVDIHGNHSHDSDLMLEASKRALDDGMELAKQDLNISPRSICANITKDLQSHNNAAAVSSLPKKSTIARKVQRARMKELDVPPCPKSWFDVKVPLPLTVNVSGEQFLILEDNLEEHRPEKILGFASPNCIEIMKTATQMFADGTFEICDNSLFFQMFIIICTTPTGINVPCAYFLLPNKETIAYKKVLSCLKNNFDITDPPIFHCDFENSIIRAVKDVFPTTRLLCCDTHFKRALRTNLQKHHLIAAYNSDPRLQQFIRYLWALSLLPIEDISKVWSEFVILNIPEVEDNEWPNVEPGDLDQFVTYFENTWIGGRNRRTGRPQNPKFKHGLWNKNEAILRGDDLTTNSSEGYNLQLKLAMPKSANLWNMIISIMKEDSLVALKLRDQAIATTSPPDNKQKAARQRRKEELHNLVGRYNLMDIKTWMNMVVAYYNS